MGKKIKRLLFLLLLALAFSLVLSAVVFFIKILCPAFYHNALGSLAENFTHEGGEVFRARLAQYKGGVVTGFLGVQLLQVFFAPIPGQFTGLAGGYLFGFWQGLGLTMLGLGMGSFLAILLSRLLGQKFVAFFLPKKLARSLNEKFGQAKLMDFFMIFLLPALPDDAICFIAGLTRLSVTKLVAICLLGRLPGMAILSYLGSSNESNRPLAITLLVIACSLALFIWLFEEKILRLFQKKTLS